MAEFPLSANFYSVLAAVRIASAYSLFYLKDVPDKSDNDLKKKIGRFDEQQPFFFKN
jgi:hypothetical protein